MWQPLIGEYAGRVWQVLKEKSPQNLAALEKAAGLKEQWLYLALGWLAREDKVAFTAKGKLVMVSLK
ncbi:MAG: winged helix-turn-helix domain-containing protein [Desulfocucumaceae bacterium]